MAGALTALLAVTGCGGATPAQAPVSNLTVHDDDGMYGAVLTDPYRLPDATLTDTSGRPYALREDTTKPLTLVFFGYTHCPDVCQVVMASIASAVNRLDPADRDDVGMLFVTSDPARDDAATLRSYLDRFDPTFEGLTGDLGDIVKVANALGVPVEKGAKMPSGGYEVAHGAQIVGVESDGTAPIVWTEGTAAQKFAADITTLLHDQTGSDS